MEAPPKRYRRILAASSALRNISGLILAALVLCAPTALLAAPEAECPRTIDPLEADVFLESWLSNLQSALDAGASMDAMDPFQLLFLQRHHTALDKKLHQGFDPDACGGPMDMSLLGTAATLGLTQDVRTILSHGAALEQPKSAYGESALMLAIRD